MKAFIAALLCVGAVTAAQAQTIWRCGPDGRSYSDTPCAQGTTLEATQRRPAEDVAAARSAAQREQALAEQLRAERLQRETIRPTAAAGIRDARIDAAQLKPQAKKEKAAGSKKPKRQHQPADDDTFRAVAPASRHAPG